MNTSGWCFSWRCLSSLLPAHTGATGSGCLCNSGSCWLSRSYIWSSRQASARTCLRSTAGSIAASHGCFPCWPFCVLLNTLKLKMADKLADMFNRRWFERLAAEFRAVHPGFKAEDFVETCSAGLDQLALNQRLRRTSLAMKEFLPTRYDKAIGIMKEVISKLPVGYTTLVFPDFVGLYGRQD